ncbi:unnamed protein product [Trichogramma brassicae]|uniref:Uncharacterized protein n=1 Tax=Trichogramma brassicae TaxID=86971 RepID=A0A6H5HYM0_9HYME|nr:unnamed protein product [Trichogramma brassicae]
MRKGLVGITGTVTIRSKPNPFLHGLKTCSRRTLHKFQAPPEGHLHGESPEWPLGGYYALNQEPRGLQRSSGQPLGRQVCTLSVRTMLLTVTPQGKSTTHALVLSSDEPLAVAVQQIKKEDLHASILDQKPTTGFWQRRSAINFYEFVYAKSKDPKNRKHIKRYYKSKKENRLKFLNSSYNLDVLVAANLDKPTPLTSSIGLYATKSRVSTRSECVIVVKNTIILKSNGYGHPEGTFVDSWLGPATSTSLPKSRVAVASGHRCDAPRRCIISSNCIGNP